MDTGDKPASVQLLNADHKDIIHDVAYNFYGNRMATCSSDQLVKVWDKNEQGQWESTAQWKAHNGSVWKVTWAHPEFGQIVASCSFDRTAVVWEEIRTDTVDSGASHWVKRNNFVDSRSDVTDVKFCPRHLGLQLATTSSDGYLRVYDCPDIMNLTQWTLTCEMNAKCQLSCLSWGTAFTKSAMIAVGSDAPPTAGSARAFIYEWSDAARAWVKSETLAVESPVHDIAFAPQSGRSYHLLGVAATDLKIFMFRTHFYRRLMEGSSSSSMAMNGAPGQDRLGQTSTKYDIRTVLEASEHAPCVWRLSWNCCGSILSSAGDDGTIRMWKCDSEGKWICVFSMKGDGKTKLEPGMVPSASEPVLQRAAGDARAQGAGGAESSPNPAASGTRFYRGAGVSQREHVPWH